MDGAKREKAPDPLGKRALYGVPTTPAPGGDAPVAAPSTKDSSHSFPAGKRALYSDVPVPTDNELDTPTPSSAGRGAFTVRCQRCRQVSHVGLLNLLIFQLPIGVWLPRGRFDRRMTCPSCRKRSWCSVTLRRG